MRQFIIITVILLLALFVFNCGKDKSSGPSVPDPIASFTESGGTVSPATIAFQNTSQNADSYVWRFDDGDSTTVTNPTHTFDVYGNYLVTLIARNTSTGKTASKLQQIIITPGSVFVDNIRVDQIPFTDQYGAGWDLTTGPDLFVNLVDAANVAISFDYYYSDVTPSSLPLDFNVSPEFQIANWTTAYFVEAWDYDDFGNDYMGTTYGFRINDVISSVGYIPSISLHNSSGTIQAVIALRWQ